ncbi:hypothetical protein PR048_012768 [Dryococelus australis]|uniref:Uncharacterized protein n=1 Tax=Dryococelus australis TaxID=614101 RepID=A0ABQ9HQD4_9NEOP|nr:hypothetical protein PR048_012768 [Dryococelus australis]
MYPPRKVLYHIRDAVKQELDTMVANNIIEPITEPTPAVSPMVVFWQRTFKCRTFATLWGSYLCLQMPFGLASALEVFQQIINEPHIARDERS